MLLPVKGVLGTVTAGGWDTSGSGCNLNKGEGEAFLKKIVSL